MITVERSISVGRTPMTLAVSEPAILEHYMLLYITSFGKDGPGYIGVFDKSKSSKHGKFQLEEFDQGKRGKAGNGKSLSFASVILPNHILVVIQQSVGPPQFFEQVVKTFQFSNSADTPNFRVVNEYRIDRKWGYNGTPRSITQNNMLFLSRKSSEFPVAVYKIVVTEPVSFGPRLEFVGSISFLSTEGRELITRVLCSNSTLLFCLRESIATQSEDTVVAYNLEDLRSDPKSALPVASFDQPYNEKKNWRFGRGSVTCNEDYLAVQSEGRDKASEGTVHIFSCSQISGQFGSHIAALTSPMPASWAEFGCSISLMDHCIVIAQKGTAHRMPAFFEFNLGNGFASESYAECREKFNFHNSQTVMQGRNHSVCTAWLMDGRSISEVVLVDVVYNDRM